MKPMTPSSAATVSDRTPSTGAVLSKAAQDARETIDKISSLMDEATRKALPAATQFAHRTVDRVAAGAAPAAAWLDEHADEINTAQAKLIDDARKYIRENPLTSVGIALAIGFLISRGAR